MSEIKMTIVGNITKKPEIKTTNQGKLVTRLRVASTRKRYIEGRWIDGESAYIDVDCWEHLAQNVVNTFGKGDRIIAEGRLRTDEWKDEQGNKRSFTKVVADSVGPDLRFATAVITRKKSNGSRVSDAERRAREEELMNGADGGEGVPDEPNESNHFDESVQRDGHGGHDERDGHGGHDGHEDRDEAVVFTPDPELAEVAS